jgi:hypothetical protein
MNFINRTFIVMLFLLTLLLSCAAVPALLFFRPNLNAALQPALTAVASDQIGVTQFFCIGVAVLVFAFSLLLLYLELMPGGKMRMRLKSIQGADVLMSADAITTQLQYALDPLPGVIRAQPKVFKGKGDAVDVVVDMTTASDVDVKKKTDEVMDVARTVLEGGLGLRVGKVQIKLEQMKPPRRGVPDLPKMDLPRLIAAKQEEATENAAKS